VSSRARAWFVARYLRIDPRTAALFRIALGLLCFADTIRHWLEAGFLYSNAGVLTNYAHLKRPMSERLFSIFHAFSTLPEVHVLFLLGLAVQLCLVLGWRSRWMALANMVFITSRDSRMLFVENGGYIAQNLACFWACFLPIERRFSIDAWRASWRAHKETSVAELSDRSDSAAERAPVVSLIALAVIANLALVYFFNVLNKTGNIWRSGDTIHYVLHINRMVTGAAVFVRETFPPFVFTVTSFVVVAVEATIFVCILSPRARFATRLLAMGLILGLHTMLGVFMRLGPFSWFLIGWSTLLLLPVHFERAHRFYARRSRPVTLGVDEASPLAITIARIIKRLDHRQRVRFETNNDGALLSVRVADGWSSKPKSVFAAVTDALPFGRWCARLVALVSVGLPERSFAWALQNATRVERFFGLSLLPSAPVSAAPVSRRFTRARVVLREVLVGYLIVCATMQAWLENKVIPSSLPPKVKEGQSMDAQEREALSLLTRWLGDTVIPLKPQETPEFLAVTNGYFRIYQGWGMFAPNPIQDDGVLAVDAVTIDGRHIDPLTGKAPDLDLSDSRGEGLSQTRQDFGNRVRFDRNQIYRDGLRNYLLDYHERSGRPDDEIVSLDIYWVRCKLPAPGERKATRNEAVPIYTWRKPAHVPRPGVAPLSPPLRLRSADKWRDKDL